MYVKRRPIYRCRSPAACLLPTEKYGFGRPTTSETSCAGCRHNMPQLPVTLTFDFLTLKMVTESRVTWATYVVILVFL